MCEQLFSIGSRSPMVRSVPHVRFLPYGPPLKWTLVLSARRLPYTAGHPGCRTLQVIQAALHCRSSRLPYTAGRPDCHTLQAIQTAVNCRSSRLPYTAGRPDCRTLQVIQTAINCRSSSLPRDFLASGVSPANSKHRFTTSFLQPLP